MPLQEAEAIQIEEVKQYLDAQDNSIEVVDTPADLTAEAHRMSTPSVKMEEIADSVPASPSSRFQKYLAEVPGKNDDEQDRVDSAALYSSP